MTGSTLVMGIFGNPVHHSLSPGMHNAAAEALGMHVVYVPFLIEKGRLGQAVEGIRALGLLGVNVTVPFKEAVCAYLDRMDPLAAQIGSVNTIVCQNHQLVGYNTDAPGFLMAIQKDLGISLFGKRVCCLGAGGTARAIGFALMGQGLAGFSILNRTVEKAWAIRDHLADAGDVAIEVEGLNTVRAFSLLAEADLVINTTSVGLSEATQMPLSTMTWVTPRQTVYDCIYRPAVTPFLAAAQERGARVSNGLGMLVAQGALAFTLLTGQEAPFDVMKRTVEDLC